MDYKKSIFVGLVSALIVVIIVPLDVSAMDEREEFTIVMLPDMQYSNLQYPEVSRAQTRWIAENIEKLNIKMVVGVGDITDSNTPEEWKNASSAFAMLDGRVPYSLAVGNHDLPGIGGNRDTSLYNSTFTLERYQRTPGWGGRMGDDNDNHFRTFSAAGLDFLVLTVEFGPTDEILEWANRIVAQHPDHHVIVTTHCYMNCDNTRVGNEDGGRPQDYAVGGNDGQAIWDKFIRKHSNIFLVLSGHMVCNQSQGFRIDNGEGNNRVIQVLSNYQDRPFGGNGWLRIIRFLPDQNQIVFTAYSPFLDRYDDDINQTYFTVFNMTPVGTDR